VGNRRQLLKSNYIWNEISFMDASATKRKMVSGQIPEETPAAEIFEFTFSGVRSALLTFDGNDLRPSRPAKKEIQQRYTLVKLRFQSKVKVCRWQVTMDGKHIALFGKPDSILLLPETILVPSEVAIETYYDRGKKRKILSAFYFENELPPSTPHRAMERFDQFYAVDTNTVSFDGFGKVSVTIAMQASTTQVGNAYGHFSAESFAEFGRQNVSGNPEISGWVELINIIRSDQENFGKKIGIVVDSELGRIQQINSRQIPLIDGFYLPQNFELVFATDASGSEEFFPNKMIRACDRTAGLNIEDIARRYSLQRVA
jgi:hypothetical protein